MPLALTADGLLTQTQEEIREALVQQLRSTFGNNLNTEPTSIMGQLVNIVSEFRALDQQVLLAVYRSFDPNSAIGVALDRLATLTGTVRNGATSSVVDGLLEFSGAGTMVNGDLILNDDNNTQWALTDGPHTAVGPYPEFIAAQFQAVDTGAILAQAGTAWSLVTVVAGLDAFTNPSDDADLGSDQETDAALRQRRNVELFSRGEGPLLSIAAVVSQVDGVLSVNVYHNPATSPTDSDGIPFKAFNVVVRTQPSTPTAALEQLIYDAIFSSQGAGGEAYGTDFVGTATDTELQTHPIAFDTVDVDDIVIEVDLTTSTSEQVVSENIESVVAEAILETANADWEVVGRDVLALDVSGVVSDLQNAGTISGVDAVTVRLSIDPAPPALVAKLPISIRSIADFDSANITVAQV